MGNYVRQDRVSRLTGTRVTIYDTQHPDNIFDPAGGRWVTVCEDHHTLCNHATLAQARGHATVVDWCEPCMYDQAVWGEDGNFDDFDKIY